MSITGLGRDVVFSFSLAGVWAERQVQAVIAALQDDCDRQGVRLELIDLTANSDAFPTFLFSIWCKRCHSEISACLCTVAVLPDPEPWEMRW